MQKYTLLKKTMQGGSGALLISAPIRNFVGLSKYLKLFGVQGILGMGQHELALCQKLMY